MRKRGTVGEPVRISSDAKDKLKTYAMSKKVSMKIILDTFIDQGVEHDIFDPKWTEHVKRVSEHGNYYESLDDACPGLTFDGLIWSCVWARQDKPPQIKKFGSDFAQANAYCKGGCSRTREMIDGYENKIKQYKEMINRGAIITIPACREGSELSDDGKTFYCRRTTETIKVSRCKTLRGGANCKSLKWIHLDAKGTFSGIIK